ncbi:carboxylesterase family protein, partial [Staphylococcus aureus]|uniref:carboxylesterase family protein n=1 Tax=Staphylococcus aureus TaxID=1280 RepID=UPI00210ADFE0
MHGITQDGLDIFLGIPYAEQPVHDNRFKHSTLKTQWSEPIDATEIQHIPPHPDNKLEDFLSSHSNTTTAHEACLYLNIWKKLNDKT